MLRKNAILPLTLALLSLPLASSCNKKDNNNAAAPVAEAVAQKQVDGASDKKNEDPNMKVAIINDKVITAGDLDKEFAPLAARLEKMNAPKEKFEEMRLMFLGKLIEREVLIQEAKKHNIQIADSEVEEDYAKFRSRFPDEAALEGFVKEAGIDVASLKDQMRQGLMIDKLIATEVESKVVVDDAALKAYYDSNTDQFVHPEQLRASHILVKAENDEQKVEAKKKADELLAKVKAGGDFAALAKEFSGCPSGQQGGDLGYFQKGQMVKPFEEACLALKPGEISGIVETQFGYHIIKLVDHKEAGMTPFDEVKEDLTKYLKSSETQKKLKEYIEAAKKQAKIERFI